MSDDEGWKSLPPTPRQLEHLQELFYDGPAPSSRGEASLWISYLHDDPQVAKRQLYEARIKEGPFWLVWERWMGGTRADYDQDQEARWREETRRMAADLGLDPPLPRD